MYVIVLACFDIPVPSGLQIGLNVVSIWFYESLRFKYYLSFILGNKFWRYDASKRVGDFVDTLHLSSWSPDGVFSYLLHAVLGANIREVTDSRTPGIFVRDTACFHCYSMNCDTYVFQWITMKICCIPYEST